MIQEDQPVPQDLRRKTRNPLFEVVSGHTAAAHALIDPAELDEWLRQGNVASTCVTLRMQARLDNTLRQPHLQPQMEYQPQPPRVNHHLTF